MNQLFGSSFIVYPFVAAAAFVIAYLWADRVLRWLHARSLGQREEILRLMDLMYMQPDKKRVTTLMLLLSFGVGGVFFILLWPHVVLGLVMGGILTVLGWSIPKYLVQSLWERRCAVFVNQMVDGMTILANGVSAGRSVQQAMQRVVETMPNPMAQEFGEVLRKINLGSSMRDALNDLATRIPRPDVQMFVLSVNILDETGGNMAETFQTITTTVRERQKVEKKIEALTAQGLTQGIIITLVPFALLIVFSAVDPNYVKPLFTTTVGIVALFAMVTLQVIGGLLIRKIVKIDV